MAKLENVISGFVIFGMLVGLMVTIYSGFQENYGIVKDHAIDDLNVMDRLQNLNLVTSINNLTTSIFKVADPDLPLDERAVAFFASAKGTIDTLLSVLSFPVEIIGVITDFYYIPSNVIGAIITIITIYLGFVVLRLKNRGEVK